MPNNPKCENVIIYGAGEAGTILCHELRLHAGVPYAPVAFVDDDTAKVGTCVAGIEVIGTGATLQGWSWSPHPAMPPVSRILIAIPSALGQVRGDILRRAQGSGLPCRFIPSYARLLDDNLIKQIRDVEISDLLGREQIDCGAHDNARAIAGLPVMVTGAAGSIGSELCWQAARHRPSTLIAVDVSESGIFALEQKLLLEYPHLTLTPCIADIRNYRAMEHLFRRLAPAAVFHAAAYKHVPMMESHPVEAIENNVLGTHHVATLAEKFGARSFVLVSTDKAVRPSSVMGATKYLAERVVLRGRRTGTRFVAVRFGNVLGSNGSVVPIFKAQIAAGGPITITHPEMSRYFMTIPEAAHLIIQAASLGQNNDVLLLEMGEPVKIVDLARNMLRLAGLRPGEDVAIQFTGMRPGEKLTEDLRWLEEEALPTEHPKIRLLRRAPGQKLTAEFLREVQAVVRNRAAEDARRVLLRWVPELRQRAASAVAGGV